MITAATALYAVLGSPVRHSLSPVLHNGWIADHRLNAAYLALDVTAQALPALGAMGLAGANVTIPHKEAALAAAQTADPLAARIGAANTLKIDNNRAIHAWNTDAPGFLAALQAGAPDWRTDRPAVVLGAGGAARAIVVALCDAGVPDIRIVNRTRDRAEAVAALSPAARVCTLEEALPGAGLIVNCTAQGLKGENPLTLDFMQTDPNSVLFDTVYAPLETALIASARTQRRTAVDGLGMLVWQAALAFEIWFGVRPDVTTGRARALAAIGAGS